MVVGGVLALIGLAISRKEFGFAWLQAYLMIVSIVMGSLFLVLVHHLFDAGWSVPIRRVCEHLGAQVPLLIALFVPIAVLAPSLFPWMGPELQTHPDPALQAKNPLFTLPGFYLGSAACFAVWFVLSRGLRGWSIRQDTTGDAACTYAMRRWSAVGIFLYAFTLTLAAIFWMKALHHQWFSTMFGVYYFAGSVWLTLATVYLITVVLERVGILRNMLHEHQYYFIGSLLFAFTVFYAYIHFSQYFIIWNANIPEETFYYLLREKGTWYAVGIILIFGHFFLPFLALLRIDAKHHFPLMAFLGAWAWCMHFLDLSFNVMPTPHPEGFPFRWVWLPLGCLAFMVGLLIKLFLKDFVKHAPYPVRDPRLIEALGHRHPVASPISGGEMPDSHDFQDQMEGPVGPEPETGGGAK